MASRSRLSLDALKGCFGCLDFSGTILGAGRDARQCCAHPLSHGSPWIWPASGGACQASLSYAKGAHQLTRCLLRATTPINTPQVRHLTPEAQRRECLCRCCSVCRCRYALPSAAAGWNGRHHMGSSVKSLCGKGQNCSGCWRPSSQQQRCACHSKHAIHCRQVRSCQGPAEEYHNRQSHCVAAARIRSAAIIIQACSRQHGRDQDPRWRIPRYILGGQVTGLTHDLRHETSGGCYSSWRQCSSINQQGHAHWAAVNLSAETAWQCALRQRCRTVCG